VFNVPSNTV